MSNKIWEFTGETKIYFGVTLRRIRASVEFKLKCGIVIDKGELGGWIEKESNLSGNAWVSGNAELYGDAVICNSNDYIVFKNNWSSFRYFTWTRSNDMWKVGCFYGTGKDLIEKAYKDSKLSGDCYKAYVELVEKLKELQK